MSSESSSPSLKHELRTPLNHIIGFCEMLMEEAEDEAGVLTEFVPDLKRIHGAGRRLSGVIDDLFDDSVPEAQRLDESHIHHEVRTPLNQIVGYTELLEEEAEDRGVKDCAGDLAKIRDAAHRLLDLVMVNFGGKGKGLLEQRGAETEASVSVLHRESPPVGGARDPAGRTVHATGVILIADDDAANREMLRRRLERLGHTVSSAADGREVVEMIHKGRYDLLLLDIVMPEMDGYQVLEYLRSNPPPEALPVIVLSASDDSNQVARCIEMGAEDYLPKPFDPALLQARIHSSLEKKRLRDREAVYLRAIQREKEKTDDLLHVILPADIAAELKAQGDVKPRRVDNVAVLFADVANFTRYCESRDPETIHRELQNLVKELEILTVANRMEKIKTIGDAYLAVAGLLRVTNNPTLDCIRCGLAMIEAAKELPSSWEIRVGVHCGPVVAGVVGRQKYQYDIWGDTVNASARMQTEAEPGKLCVSAATWELIKDRCEGQSLGVRDIKGKGKIEVYDVSAVRELR